LKDNQRGSGERNSKREGRETLIYHNGRGRKRRGLVGGGVKDRSTHREKRAEGAIFTIDNRGLQENKAKKILFSETPKKTNIWSCDWEVAYLHFRNDDSRYLLISKNNFLQIILSKCIFKYLLF